MNLKERTNKYELTSGCSLLLVSVIAQGSVRYLLWPLTSPPLAAACWLIVEVKVTLLILKVRHLSGLKSLHPEQLVFHPYRQTGGEGGRGGGGSVRTDAAASCLRMERGRVGWVRWGEGVWGWIRFRHDVRRRAADFIDCSTRREDWTAAKYRCRTEQDELSVCVCVCVCVLAAWCVQEHEAASPALSNIYIKTLTAIVSLATLMLPLLSALCFLPSLAMLTVVLLRGIRRY